MNAQLVIGSIDTSYGPLSVAVVVGDHSHLPALAGAATRTRPAAATDPVVVASGWTDGFEFLPRLDPEVAALARPSSDNAVVDIPASIVGAVTDWDAGDAAGLDDVAVAQPGGEFRQHAWTALRNVPAGTVVTYSELAELAGNPRASRAAGSACATNMVAPFVPCHRVVQAGGKVGHYAYGPDLKTSMLVTEGAILAL
jgi:methylated-DNA-[protein]-cysteine S-methyltransferase